MEEIYSDTTSIHTENIQYVRRTNLIESISEMNSSLQWKRKKKNQATSNYVEYFSKTMKTSSQTRRRAGQAQGRGCSAGCKWRWRAQHHHISHELAHRITRIQGSSKRKHTIMIIITANVAAATIRIVTVITKSSGCRSVRDSGTGGVCMGHVVAGSRRRGNCRGCGKGDIVCMTD